MRASWASLLLLVVPLVAAAGGGKAGKAEKQLAAFEAGDREALVRAAEYADAAVEGQPDARAWAVRGRVYLKLASSPDVARPGGDPAAVAVEAYERALAAGPDEQVRAAMADEVPVLASTVVAALVNDVESKQWADAKGRLDQALRAVALAEKLGGRDAEREATVQRLAVQVTAQAGDLAAAKAHYAAFVAAAGRQDTGLAALVARKLAGAGDLDGALAFLAPLDQEAPDDERLLRTEVELLVGAGREDDATARIQRAEERLASSVSGAFLAATLYEQAGSDDRARVMWERVVALDPRHIEGQIALGRSYTRLAQSLRDERASLGEEATLKGSSEVVRLDEGMAEAYAAAEEHLLAARALDGQSRPALEALVALYEARLAGVDEATLPSRVQREQHAARKKQLDEAKAALAALEAR